VGSPYEFYHHSSIHRGTDEQGEYQSQNGLVSFAMRGLNIIDLESGHQPMHNETPLFDRVQCRNIQRAADPNMAGSVRAIWVLSLFTSGNQWGDLPLLQSLSAC